MDSAAVIKTFAAASKAITTPPNVAANVKILIASCSDNYQAVTRSSQQENSSCKNKL
jgi:hypothetical protein